MGASESKGDLERRGWGYLGVSSVPPAWRGRGESPAWKAKAWGSRVWTLDPEAPEEAQTDPPQPCPGPGGHGTGCPAVARLSHGGPAVPRWPVGLQPPRGVPRGLLVVTRDRRSRQVLGFLPVPCPVSSPQWGPGTGRALRGSCYHEWPESCDMLAGRRRWGPARSCACCGYRHPRSAAGTPRLGLGGSPTSAPLRLPCVWLLPQVKPVGPPDPRPRVCRSSSTATSGPGPGGCLPLGQVTDGGWRPGRRSTRTGSAGRSSPPGCPGGSGACVGGVRAAPRGP